MGDVKAGVRLLHVPKPLPRPKHLRGAVRQAPGEQGPCKICRSCREPRWSIRRRCFAFSGMMKSRHSRRTVPISRSQYAFACGDYGGVRTALSPNPCTSSSSSSAEKIESRSWITKWCVLPLGRASRNCCALVRFS